MGDGARRGEGEVGSWARLKSLLVWQEHVRHRGQGERGLRDPPNLIVPAGSARGLAYNVPSLVAIIPVAASGVPKAACAAPLARAAALCRRAERARLSCSRRRKRVGGRAPRGGGPLGSFRLLGGGARLPTPLLAHVPRGGPARQSLGGTPHCVPAGGGRGIPVYPARFCCRCDNSILGSYFHPLFDEVRLSLFLIVFILRTISLAAPSKKSLSYSVSYKTFSVLFASLLFVRIIFIVRVIIYLDVFIIYLLRRYLFVMTQESLLTQRTRTIPKVALLLLLLRLRNNYFEMMTC